MKDILDRLAKLEALVSHLIKANKVEFGDLCLLPESNPPVPPSEFEANAFDNDGNPIQIRLSGGPAPSDEPKEKQSRGDRPGISLGWIANFLRRINSKEIDSVEAAEELVKITDELADACFAKEPTSICISRKVAEEWLKIHENTRYAGRAEVAGNAMLDELRRAIGK